MWTSWTLQVASCGTLMWTSGDRRRAAAVAPGERHRVQPASFRLAQRRDDVRRRATRRDRRTRRRRPARAPRSAARTPARTRSRSPRSSARRCRWSARRRHAGPVALERPTSSAAKCWASAALPPLPNTRTLPPARTPPRSRPRRRDHRIERLRPHPLVQRDRRVERAPIARSARRQRRRRRIAGAGVTLCVTDPRRLHVGDELLCRELQRLVCLHRHLDLHRVVAPHRVSLPSRPASGCAAGPGGRRQRSRTCRRARARPSWPTARCRRRVGIGSHARQAHLHPQPLGRRPEAADAGAREDVEHLEARVRGR